MSSFIKWIVVIIIIGGAGAALWWSGWLNSIGLSMKTNTQAPATTTPEVQQPAPVSDLPTQTTDTSDAALVQDAAALDAQLQAYQGDSTSVDQSLNDKPVTQEF